MKAAVHKKSQEVSRFCSTRKSGQKANIYHAFLQTNACLNLCEFMAVILYKYTCVNNGAMQMYYKYNDEVSKLNIFISVLLQCAICLFVFCLFFANKDKISKANSDEIK